MPTRSPGVSRTPVPDLDFHTPAPDQLVSEAPGALLIGYDRGLFSKRARAGKYGPVVRDGQHLLVMLSGIEQACQRRFSIAQVRAAITGRPLPPGGPDRDLLKAFRAIWRKPSLDQRTVDMNLDVLAPMRQRDGFLVDSDDLDPDGLSDFTPDTPDTPLEDFL